MSHSIEKRTVKASVLAGDSKDFELIGLAAAYNSLSGDIGGFKERIAPGAFTRALNSHADVRCLVNHDPSQILGRTKSGTLTLSDSAEGLRFLCRLNPESVAHKNIYTAVQCGDIDQCSFAFVTAANGDRYETAKNGSGHFYSLRTLTDVDLFDVSIVTYPAYPNGTRVQARSANYSPARLVTEPRPATWAALRAKAAEQQQTILMDFARSGMWEDCVNRANLNRIGHELEAFDRRERVRDMAAEISELKKSWGL
jgi:uncharacterized protein